MHIKNKENSIDRDDALNILDRVIDFINNCDNKTSIILGVFGVIITVILTTDGIGGIKRILDASMETTPCCGIPYLILWMASLITIFIGLFKLVSVLIAKLDFNNSNIYFGSISRNGTSEKYQAKLLSISDDEIISDIISEIYINSKICTKKFSSYNLGLKLTVIGSFAFLLLWVIGSYVF